MLSVKITCEVTENGIVTLRLPHTISPGRHEIIVVIDEQTAMDDTSLADTLMQFAGTWKSERIDAVEYQHQLREEWT